MPLNISIVAAGYTSQGYSFWLNSTNRTTIQLTSADTTFPVINTTFNITSPLFDSVINFTASATDETALLFVNWLSLV